MCGECAVVALECLSWSQYIDLNYYCRGLKYVSKYRKERIRAIADYICLPKDFHEHTSASVQNGLSLDHSGHSTTWNSQSTVAGSSSNGNNHDSTSNGTDDEGTPLQKSQATFHSNGNTSNGSAGRGSDSTRNESRWDVVCLQELWCSEDWEYMQERLKTSGSGLIHGRYFWR